MTEGKRLESGAWAEARFTEKECRCSGHQEPRQKSDSILATASKRLAEKFYQLMAGHGLAGQYLDTSSSAALLETPTESPVGRGAVRVGRRAETGWTPRLRSSR